MVFSNSLMTNLSLWDRQTAMFSGSYRILRYDQRGHGQTEVPAASRCSYDDLAADAAALLDAFQIEDATFIGVSMGAITSLLLASRCSQRVARAVAADGQWFAPPTAEAVWEERITLAQQRGMETLADLTLQRWFSPAFFSSGVPALTEVRDMVRTTPLVGFVQCARALERYDFQQEFARITLPVLLIAGEKDGQLPQAMRKTHAAIAGSQFVEIAGAGHLVNIEAPEVFYRAIEDFCLNHPSRP
jgi:3-oxoadipate enol-lactonase